MIVKFWGVHGSLPTPGTKTLKYGGNTACVEVRCDHALIILDAGSGIRELGDHLLVRSRNDPTGNGRIQGHILFSHFHWDHIQGFPFFAPMYVKGNEFHLYGFVSRNSNVEKTLRRQMSSPNFPLTMDDFAARVHFHDLNRGDSIRLDDVTVKTAALNHPGGSIAYRIEHEGRSVTYATDAEYADGPDKMVVELARDTDLLISDSMFTPEQYHGLWDGLPRKSWGHGTWDTAVELAQASGAKKLVLFHHGNEDKITERIANEARDRFPLTLAAYEGLEIIVH
ncbi:MAG: MBL fold metallo-hydrolase [Thermodesulfobacteriota bacterium]